MTNQTVLAPGIAFGDLRFQGSPNVIASVLLHDKAAVAIIDPGPASTLPVLRELLSSSGAGVNDIAILLLTHIHLDHAGATGTLVRENPRIRVFVHESGVRHLVDPSRLVASAARLYGDDMDRLWGEVLPVPLDRITSLSGGERVAAGGREWSVAYTPGHASHHVSYFDRDSRVAFVGDTAGVQVIRGGFVLPPTPPPDIDVPAWMESLSTIEAWNPQTLFLTHFGPMTDVSTHLAELRDHLHLVERFARDAIRTTDDSPRQEALFIAALRDEMRRRMSEDAMIRYQMAGRFDLNWRGIERYVRKGLGK